MHGLPFEKLPEDLKDELFALEYRQRFSLSVEQYEKEPEDATQLARIVWSLETQSDNLAAEAQAMNK